MGAVGMDFEEPEAVMIVEAKHDPSTIWRVGTNEGADVPAFVMRYKM